MAVELNKDEQERALASLDRYFREHFPDGLPVDGEGRPRLGQLSGVAFLGFLTEEIGPLIYNRAVADVQDRLLARVQEVDIEIHEEAFTYWAKFDGAQVRRGGRGR